jgi:hypothetical protein
MRICRGRCGTSKVGAVGMCGEGEAGNQQQPQPDHVRNGQKLDICAQRRRRSGGNKVRSRQSAPSRWFTAAPILIRESDGSLVVPSIFPFSSLLTIPGGDVGQKSWGATSASLSDFSTFSTFSSCCRPFKKVARSVLKSNRPHRFYLTLLCSGTKGFNSKHKTITPWKIDHTACRSRFLRGRSRRFSGTRRLN